MENNLKIAFVGNFYGHGSVYDQWGTSFCILLSRLDYVDRIDVICPVSTNNYETVFPKKDDISKTPDCPPGTLYGIRIRSASTNKSIKFFSETYPR